jgi:hypothetical protein
MPYFMTFKHSYMAQFIDLPKNLQKRLSLAQEELECDPTALRGDTIRKLVGTKRKDLYRYRLDD